ncbi:MAG TPA: anti-sigma factor, partial [Candidatus Limnocylindrales bacterium]|nr:anti-sigma factor [Candidatus Limnocylindrales bacterium]
ATCEVCTRDVEAWRRTAAVIEVARGSGPERLDLADLAADAPIPAPPGLRAAVAEAIRRAPDAAAIAADRTAARPALVVASGPAAQPPAGAGVVDRAAEPRPRRVARLVLPLVAVLAVVAVGGALLLDQVARLDRAGAETAALESVAATVDRILRDPDHKVVALVGADGIARGSLAWSRHDIVVLTKSLDAPPADREYRCWLEKGGSRSPVGKMWFAGGTAFWNGSLDEWATISFDDGGTFGVSLEPVGAPEGNPAVLAADLDG